MRNMDDNKLDKILENQYRIEKRLERIESMLNTIVENEHDDLLDNIFDFDILVKDLEKDLKRLKKHFNLKKLDEYVTTRNMRALKQFYELYYPISVTLEIIYELAEEDEPAKLGLDKYIEIDKKADEIVNQLSQDEEFLKMMKQLEGEKLLFL
ncbi:hypothetical protein KFV08_02775 [Macrococcoides canis]|uniref:hypothetical protein n=2 Tax=Macrococcoides canis TaxID=1855823 RepID=UPI0020B6CBF5|nr:hypothetical protein [Macrococcus canis]UTH09717.1 hypothetical protein KFV08_02775 [Macrococcus canis]